MHRSFKFRIRMTDRVGRAFEAAVRDSNEIYNAALEERIGAWRASRTLITKFDQFKSLTVVRENDSEFSRYAAAMLRRLLEQVHDAFQGFFSRVKHGTGKAGYPRFRSLRRIRSFGFTEASGWTLKGPKLSMKGLPTVHVRMHRPLEGEPTRLTIKRDGRGRWFAIVGVRLPEVYGPITTGAKGYDLGIDAVVTDSDGVRHGRVGPDRCGAARRARVERDMARRRRGSRRWHKSVRRLAALRQREADARRTAHFQIANAIVRGGPQVLVFEDLRLANMTRSAKGTVDEPGRNVAAKSGLNRSLLDAGLAQFLRIVTDKAESAGRIVITVDPRNTSQDCSGCDARVEKALEERWHHCPSCGLRIHRDHNGARNVLHRGVVAPDRRAA